MASKHHQSKSIEMNEMMDIEVKKKSNFFHLFEVFSNHSWLKFRSIKIQLYSHKKKRHFQEIEPIVSGSTTCIQDLNDYCLLKALSLKWLNLIDLCSLAEACPQLKQVAQRVAPIRIEISRTGNDYSITPSVNQCYRINDVKRIFANFGSILTEVRIYASCRRSVVNFLAKHCIENLKILTISHKFKKIDAVKLRPIFNGLHKLELIGCSMIDDETLFSGLDWLVFLRLDCVSNCGVILKKTFPSLERFAFSTTKLEEGLNETMVQTRNMVADFILRHKDLRTLAIRCFDIACQTIFANAIANNLKNLEELSFSCVFNSPDSAIQPLQKLTLLRALEIFNVSFRDFELLSTLSNLRELTLDHVQLPTDVHQFASLSQLIKLELVNVRDFHPINLAGVVSKLTQLRELRYTGIQIILNERSFYEIAKITNRRQHVLILKCYFRFELTKFDGNQKIRLIKLRVQ